LNRQNQQPIIHAQSLGRQDRQIADLRPMPSRSSELLAHDVEDEDIVDGAADHPASGGTQFLTQLLDNARVGIGA
jgi:hypothetical protein